MRSDAKTSTGFFRKLLFRRLAYGDVIKAFGTRGEQQDHTGAQKTVLAELVGGSSNEKEAFEELLESVREAGKILRGEMKSSREFSFTPEDVQAIRKRLKKSQDEFALMIGVSVATLRNWEQGRRQPHGPARALLKIAAENPKAVEKALGRH